MNKVVAVITIKELWYTKEEEGNLSYCFMNVSTEPTLKSWLCAFNA